MDSYKNVGPGAYDTPNEFDEMARKAANMKNKDKQFGVSKRAMFNESKSKNEPGPGHY